MDIIYDYVRCKSIALAYTRTMFYVTGTQLKLAQASFVWHYVD